MNVVMKLEKNIKTVFVSIIWLPSSNVDICHIVNYSINEPTTFIRKSSVYLSTVYFDD